MSENKRLRVGVIFGGRSGEHEVSLASAASVIRALDPEKYEAVPIGIGKDGRWFIGTPAQKVLPDVLRQGQRVMLSADPNVGALMPLEQSGAGSQRVGVIFPVLHGTYGEDGTVQGLLELAGLPYVGSGVIGSAVGMDKVMMKRAFAACRLPIATYASFRDGHDRVAFAAQVEAEIGYPCFVKPGNLGSSVGVSKARDRASFDAALDLALSFDEWAIVEEAIDGREIEVAVLGDDPPEASVPGEILPGDEFYSYADKYERADAQLLAPAPLSPEQTDDVRRLAVRAFEACRCE